jgi:hypothetical protein
MNRTLRGFDFWITERGVAGCTLLTGCFLALDLAVIYGLSVASCGTCGGQGFLGALFLMGCLYGGSAFLCRGDPFARCSVDLLVWYYASYLVNAAALWLSLLECFLLYPSPRWKPRVVPQGHPLGEEMPAVAKLREEPLPGFLLPYGCPFWHAVVPVHPRTVGAMVACPSCRGTFTAMSRRY